MYDIIYLGKDTLEWRKLKAKYPTASRTPEAATFKELTKKSWTKMFWLIWDDVIIDSDFDFENFKVPEWDQKYVHVFLNGIDYSKAGVCLCPKNTDVSNREFSKRFFIEKKEVQLKASGPKILYDQFLADSYDDYLHALENSTTEMFWIIYDDLEVKKDFKFDLVFDPNDGRYDFDRDINHVFLNSHTYNGIILCTKKKIISKREFEYRHLIDRKEWAIEASTVKPYGMVFISYNESNADANFNKIKERFPYVQRVHGVKGIHQAHIAAAKLTDTHMFWAIDGDAVIEDNFNFDFRVSNNERDIVHVWHSKNPINGLVYGYGGVKLLPRTLTLKMNEYTADMTTSISSRFKSVPRVSNITEFNTDPYSTWKSAFRECVKLASKLIPGQRDRETEKRLEVWCTKGSNLPFGEYAIDGAIRGKKFGEENRTNKNVLSKINDFDWLQEQFYLIYKDMAPKADIYDTMHNKAETHE